jgi:capsular polysaccharide biosynthesis protein
MSLPTFLQPAWPVFKRAHRLASLSAGYATRMISLVLKARGAPRGARTTSRTTAERTPGAVLHEGGPAEHRTCSPPAAASADHWVFSSVPVLEIPGRFTLELPRGVVVGDYGAVITEDGMLDFETSGYFGIANWREHPIFLRPVLPPPRDVRGRLLNLTTRGTSTNYYHFLFDALPRYGIFRECLPDTSVDAVLVPHATRYQRQLLAMLDLDAVLLQPARGRAWRGDRLLVPSTPNNELAAPAWVVDWLRQTFRPRSVGRQDRRLYITRGDRPNTRRFVREAALWPELERRGFERVDPGTLSVQEQIDLFHGADVIVGPHGAGLTNLVFCQPGARILELFAADYVHLGLWNITHSIEGVTYRYLVAPGGAKPGSPMTGVLSDVDIDPAEVLDVVDELIG